MNFFHIFVVVVVGFACVGLCVREEEEEPITSGPCGPKGASNIIWTYDNATHTITFTGSGNMNPYSRVDDSTPPWQHLKSEIETAVFDKNITSIGNGAFYGCGKLKSIIFPDKISSIPYYFCQGCSSIESIEVPEGVGEIVTSAFQGCSKLKYLHLPDTVTRIGSYAIHGCKSLTTITLPKSLTKIDNFAFEYSSGLKSIVIPEKVTWIGDYSFAMCSSLTTVIMPGSVTSVGSCPFLSCGSLKSIGYLGTQDPKYSYGIFSYVPKLLCVPEEYNSTKFLGCSSFTKNSSLCGALYKQDSCNEAVYDIKNNTWVLIERENTPDECLFMAGSDRIQTVTVFAYMLILIFTIVLLP